MRPGNYFGLINTIGMKLRVLVELGRLDEARKLVARYLNLAFDQNELTSLAEALMDAATLAALQGDFSRAARLYGAGRRASEDAGGQAPPELVRRMDLKPLLEANLDRSTLAGLMAEGRQLAAGQAVAYALDTGAD
jgi:hypothetical protein